MPPPAIPPSNPSASPPAAAPNSDIAPVLTYQEASAKLTAIGQQHLLAFYSRLAPDAQRSLLEQVSSLDFDNIPAWIDTYIRRKPVISMPKQIDPPPTYPNDPTSPRRSWNRDHYFKLGSQLIAQGRAAAFTVAGGQGSRLGFEGPKGCYPAGAVTRKPLFACLADWIHAAQRRFAPNGPNIPWYIMTSPLNHQPTIDFFAANKYFGLHPTDVMFFTQGVVPSFDAATGKILLASQGAIALNPDGHGGSLRALHTSGAIDDMKRRGVQHISYTQIDNPLARVIDPVFLGLHAAAPDSSAQMSSKMIPKAYPKEKLGVLCAADGKTTVIEYSDLPDELAEQRLPDGSLRFNAGSIAVHMISVDFVSSLNASGKFNLPFHRADKKIPHIDINTGQPVEPTANNGVKLETFVFDALPLCTSSIVFETDRTDEFAPIKNAEGVDSPDSCTAIQTQRAANWLAAAGRNLPRKPDGSPDCVIELSPLTAMWPGDLANAKLPPAITPGQRLVI